MTVDLQTAAQAASAIKGARKAVAFSGAGISTASGIPDFRSAKTGMWANVDPAKVASTQVLHDDPATFWKFYRERFTGLEGKQPNAAHLALAQLGAEGLLAGVVTQNVDGLHQAAGSTPVAELHGNLKALRCCLCGETYTPENLRELTDERGVPRCRACVNSDGNVVRPGIVLFGEMLPQVEVAAANSLIGGCDVLLAIGSSLQVAPASHIPAGVLHDGGTLILLTRGDTPYDKPDPWTARRANGTIIRMDCDIVQGMAAIVDALDLRS